MNRIARSAAPTPGYVPRNCPGFLCRRPMQHGQSLTQPAKQARNGARSPPHRCHSPSCSAWSSGIAPCTFYADAKSIPGESQQEKFIIIDFNRISCLLYCGDDPMAYPKRGGSTKLGQIHPWSSSPGELSGRTAEPLVRKRVEGRFLQA